MGEIHFLDNASTTKLHSDVLKEMLPYFEELYFNSSSNNIEAKGIRVEIEEAREKCAALINAKTNEIIFTSGATEAINFALKGYFDENYDKGNHLITCKTEHKAVLNTCAYLEERGVEVTYLDVDANGEISLSDLESSIKSTTALIALMYVNNETGVIHDIKSISSIAKKYGVAVFCDATQAVGKLPIDVIELEVDLLCVSGHKIQGPKGIGFLYIRHGIKLTPLIHGGSQENNLRGGTYNSPLIIGLGKACEIVNENFERDQIIYNDLNQYVINKIKDSKSISLIAYNTKRVKNIFNFFIKDLDANVFISESKNIYVSNGSACTSMIIEGSHVLRAMGYSNKDCSQCLRVSVSSNNTSLDLEKFFEKLL